MSPEPTTFLEALRAVNHTPKCASNHRMAKIKENEHWMRVCDCDYRERIAKGIEAAFRAGQGKDWTNADTYEESDETRALRAFVQAASL